MKFKLFANVLMEDSGVYLLSGSQGERLVVCNEDVMDKQAEASNVHQNKVHDYNTPSTQVMHDVGHTLTLCPAGVYLAPTCHFLQVGPLLLSSRTLPPAAAAAQVRKVNTLV